MSKIKNTNLKENIFKGELIRIDYLIGKHYRENLSLVGLMLEDLRI